MIMVIISDQFYTNNGTASTTRELNSILKTARKIDEKKPNMVLKKATITIFRNDLLDGDVWGKRGKLAMREKY